MTDTIDSSVVASNVRIVLHNIRLAAERAGRSAQSIRLVAATKSVSVDRIQAGIAAGLTLLGENRLQEALDKIDHLGRRTVGWHFIGRIQRRKVRSIVGVFEMIHSVDSLDLAVEIDRRARQADLCQSVLLEVNIAGESTKGGFSPSAIEALLPELNALGHLSIKGLMTIPPPSSTPQAARPYFHQLRELAKSLTRPEWERIRMDELSMGMSQDYEAAVEEGATLVRVGTAIFGARDQWI
ncbi:MAG: YggS family pyridoxal phosphate-dependent enzyme [Nitrospiraceae bacterium]